MQHQEHHSVLRPLGQTAPHRWRSDHQLGSSLRVRHRLAMRQPTGLTPQIARSHHIQSRCAQLHFQEVSAEPRLPFRLELLAQLQFQRELHNNQLDHSDESLYVLYFRIYLWTCFLR